MITNENTYSWYKLCWRRECSTFPTLSTIPSNTQCNPKDWCIFGSLIHTATANEGRPPTNRCTIYPSGIANQPAYTNTKKKEQCVLFTQIFLQQQLQKMGHANNGGGEWSFVTNKHIEMYPFDCTVDLFSNNTKQTCATVNPLGIQTAPWAWSRQMQSTVCWKQSNKQLTLGRKDPMTALAGLEVNKIMIPEEQMH